MYQNAAELRLEDLEIKPNLITELKNAGIESIFDLAVSVPYDLNEHMLSGADELIALDLVLKAKVYVPYHENKSDPSSSNSNIFTKATPFWYRPVITGSGNFL